MHFEKSILSPTTTSISNSHLKSFWVFCNGKYKSLPNVKDIDNPERRAHKIIKKLCANKYLF